MMKRILIATGLALSAAAVSAPVTVHTAQANAYCQPAHQGYSIAFRKKSRALKSAKRTWEREARRKFGMRYNKWHRATNRTGSCSYNGRQHTCVVQASACAKPPLRKRIVPTGTLSTSELN